MMEMPKLLDEHRRLKALAGNWAGEEKIYPSPWDPKGGTATSRFQARADLDGFFLIADYVQERGGQAGYRGHGVYGYDPQQKRYTMHWFDSMGSATTAPVLGTWEGSRLTFEGSHPMGHSRYIYVFEGENRYAFTIENSQDGRSWTTFIEGRFTRK
jgi:hypothetical protein